MSDEIKRLRLVCGVVGENVLDILDVPTRAQVYEPDGEGKEGCKEKLAKYG
jgi:hypothetical protein